MKVKGINVFELHVEKIVLGATLVLAGLLAARQFLTNPNAVTFDRTEYRPSEVDEAIQERANRLSAQLRSDRHIDYQTGEPLAQWFADEHSRLLGSGQKLASPIIRPTPLQIGDASIVNGSVGLFAEFNPPAPLDLRVVARPYTLDDKTLEEHPGLAKYLPAEPPFDIPVVHIIGKVNGPMLREALLRPEEGRNAIPFAWWDNDMSILDVVVERERRMSDGSWSEPTIVPTIPDQNSVRDLIADAGSTGRSTVLDTVFADGKELYAPPFYTLMDGEKWTTDMVRAMEPRTPEELEAIGKLTAAWKNVVKAQRKLDNYLNVDERSTSGSGGGPGKGGPGPGLGEGGTGGSSQGQPDKEERRQQERQMRIDALKGRLEAAQKKYAEEKDNVLALLPSYTEFPDEELQKEDKRSAKQSDTDEGGYQEGGFGEGGGGFGEGQMGLGGEGTGKGDYGKGAGREYEGLPRGRSTGTRDRRQTADEKPLLEDVEREVWVHDLALTTGAVYRYRMRIDYYNPFFGRENRLSDEQKALAEKVYVSSAATEWSDPVNVVSTKQFYVVDGTYNESVADRQASVEVYVYTSGSERMAAMTVRSGEPIGEIRSIMVASTGDEDTDPSNPSRTEDTNAPSEELREIDFTTGAVILDVVQVEEGATSRDRKVQVLVALEDGTIVALDPSEQRRSEDRLRLRELAAKDTKS